MEPRTAADDPSDRDRVKGPWSPEEDDRLSSLVKRHGPRNWTLISKGVPGRSGKSCRLRWFNQLSPNVEIRPFTAQEDEFIIRAQASHGNSWATIARMLRARSDNAVKNHWNSTLKRRVLNADNLEEAEKRQRLLLSPCRPKSPPDNDVVETVTPTINNVSTELSLGIPGTTDGMCEQSWDSETRILATTTDGMSEQSWDSETNLVEKEELQQENTAVIPKELLMKLQEMVRDEVRSALNKGSD